MRRLKFEVWSSAFAALLVGVGVCSASCGLLPKKVTKNDCEKWGEHFAKLAKDASDGELENCVLDKPTRKMFKKTMDEEADSTKEEIVKGCATQEGKSYVAKDAECYLKASKMKQLKTCNFRMPFFTDFATMGESWEKTLRSSCDSIERANSGGLRKGDQ